MYVTETETDMFELQGDGRLANPFRPVNRAVKRLVTRKRPVEIPTVPIPAGHHRAL
jgi:hypothetical protein